MTDKILPFAHTETKFVPNVAENQQRLAKFLKNQGVDIFIATSQDMFLSEYCPLGVHERYALSNFSGSTGDGVFVADSVQKALSLPAPFMLFVDGRYFIQADMECNTSQVYVHKIPLDAVKPDAVMEWLENVNLTNLCIGISATKISYARLIEIKALAAQKSFSIKMLDNTEIEKALNLPGFSINRPIKGISEAVTGRTPLKNIKAIQRALPSTPDTCCFVTGTGDDTAWLLSARGYHLPHSATVCGWTFTIGSELILFLPQTTQDCAVSLTIDSPLKLTIIRANLSELKNHLQKFTKISHLVFNSSSVNAFLPLFLQEIWPNIATTANFTELTNLRAHKTNQELSSIKDSCLRSSRAIAQTMRFVKNAFCGSVPTTTQPITEYSLAQKIATEYFNEKALSLSFATISATADFSAIVHYGGADIKRQINLGDFVLLDSGAYYEYGFATDCTRTVLAGANPQNWQKEIYTLVAKGVANCFIEPFAKETLGSVIDDRARSIIKKAGYDYNHGTGHGIGIGVHESGVRLSSKATITLPLHGVVSVEPGIYLADKGGVRIENLAIIEQSPNAENDLYLHNIIWVGLDWDLMDLNLLTEAEKTWFKWYETECQKLGTFVTQCPLLTT